jgi:hypothetical protein
MLSFVALCIKAKDMRSKTNKNTLECRLLKTFFFFIWEVLLPVERSEGKGRIRRSWDCSIKTNFDEMMCECGDWIQLAHGRSSGRLLVTR